jgi:hypothetical protein
LAGAWVVVLTGVIIGLGSNPTQEIIKAQRVPRLENALLGRRFGAEDHSLRLTGFNVAIPARLPLTELPSAPEDLRAAAFDQLTGFVVAAPVG